MIDKSEWLRKKAQQFYGEDNKKATFQADRIRKTEGKILEIILNNDKNGVPHIQLAKVVGLDRKNLTPYTKRLIEKKLIRRESGKQGKYFPTEEAYRDTRLSAYVFGRNFRTNLLKKENLVVNDMRVEKEIPGWYCLDFTGYRHYFEPKFAEKDKLERSIFEFSNKVGAFITYVLICAMNPDNKQLINSKEDIEKDELIQEWIKNAILPIIPSLTWEFRDSIYKAFDKYPKNYEDQVKFMKKRPRFLLNENDSLLLSSAFTRLYPLLTFELVKILKELPHATDSFKEELEYMKQKSKEQESCEHQYGQPTDTLGGYGRQCIKCHYIEKLKNPIRL